MSGRSAQDLWHLTIDDLLTAPVEEQRLTGPGPFVINLSASTAPISISAKTLVGFEQCRVFQVTTKDDGRARFHLRLGFFSSVENVEKAVEALRSRYPSAFAMQATPDDLRFVAKSNSAQVRQRVRTDGARKIGKKRDVRSDHAPRDHAPRSGHSTPHSHKHNGSGANNLTTKQLEALEVEAILNAALAEPTAAKPRKPAPPPQHSAGQSKQTRARRPAAPEPQHRTPKRHDPAPRATPVVPKSAPPPAKHAPVTTQETPIDLHLIDRIFEAPAAAPAPAPSVGLDDTARAALELLTKPRTANAPPAAAAAPTAAPAKSQAPEEVSIDLQMVDRIREPASTPTESRAPSPASAAAMRVPAPQPIATPTPAATTSSTGKSRRPEEVPIDLDFVDTIVERIRVPLEAPAPTVDTGSADAMDVEELPIDLHGIARLFEDEPGARQNATTPAVEPAVGVPRQSDLITAALEVASKAEAKAKAEAESQSQALAEARLRSETEARIRAEVETQVQAELGQKARAEMEARLRAEAEARARAEAEEKLRAEQEARIRAEAEARIRVEIETRAKAELEARLRAEEEARARVEAERRALAESEARVRAEVEAKLRAETEARLRAEAEGRVRAETEARLRAEAEQKARTEAEKKARAEAEARTRAEAEAKARAEAEAQARAQAEAKARAQAEKKAKAEAEAKARAEAEAKARAEAEKRAHAEAEAKARAAAEKKARAEADAKARAEAEAKARAEAEARARAQAEAKTRAEAETRARAEAEAQARAQAERKARAEANAVIRPPVVVNDPSPPDLDSTQTLRALTSVELSDDGQSKWFIVQLALSEQPVNLLTVPHLDIFDEYHLYTVAGTDQGRVLHSLRLGFFSEEVSASVVAGYLKTYFSDSEIKRVSAAEHERFKDRRSKSPHAESANGASAATDSKATEIVLETKAPRVYVPMPAAAPKTEGKKSRWGRKKDKTKTLGEELVEEARQVALSESAIRRLPSDPSLWSRLFKR